MFNFFNKREIVSCDYCETDNFINEDLRCKSCGAPLNVKDIINENNVDKNTTNDTIPLGELIKKWEEPLEIKGGQGNFRLMVINNFKYATKQLKK
jgi:hypothetical protein